MSKYFDQTFKTGDVGTDPEKLQITGIDKFLETVSSFKNSAPGLAASGDLGESRLGQCRKMKIPAVGKLLGQFGGGPALEAAEESYRALRTRLLRARSAQGLRSVVVTSATPGEGKTLTSLNLSLCCAQLHDLRVLLIDADIRTSGLSRTLGFPPGPGLVDVLSGKCEPRDAILATDIPNLYALGSGSHTTQPAELFATSHWQEFISWWWSARNTRSAKFCKSARGRSIPRNSSVWSITRSKAGRMTTTLTAVTLRLGRRVREVE